jgi:hypothetical protein
MSKKVLVVAMGSLFAVLIYSGPVPAGYGWYGSGLNGTYLVQASGTAYFPYMEGYPPGASQNSQEVLHFTVAGTATFKGGTNTAVSLTLNLGGDSTYGGTTSYWPGNDVICYLNAPGDLFYTPGSGSTPAMLTITSTSYTADSCGAPNGLLVNSEVGKVIPFNFYPSLSGGLIVSNYTYATTGGATAPNYPNAFIDTSGSPATDFSVTGQLTHALSFP